MTARTWTGLLIGLGVLFGAPLIVGTHNVSPLWIVVWLAVSVGSLLVAFYDV